MIDAANLNSLFSMNSVWFIVKLLYLAAFIVYLGFTIVVASQVRQMKRTVVTGFEPAISIVSWVQIGAAILAFIWALMVL